MEEKNNYIRGYKVFAPDWTCRDKQYACPGRFEEDVMPEMCSRGMHFCKKAIDCFNYYDFNPENKVAVVLAYGYVLEEGNKCCTNKLQIERELSWAEVLDLVNTGRDCTGRGNSGDYNSGDWNSGSDNSGHYNSGDYNSGSWNSGSYNSGYYNSGDYNSGNWNSGNCNSGDCNSGDWNKASFSNGCFNTCKSKVYFFDKPSEWSYADWKSSAACLILSGLAVGEITSVADRNIWWRNLSITEKFFIKTMPNFNKEIFKEITGIDIDAGQ